MEDLDATTFGQAILKLGLVSESQLLDARAEFGEGNNDREAFVRLLERKGFLTPWQTERFFKGHTDGFFLHGYRILYKIASGSFGRVFRAEDPRDGRVVAIKILRRRWSEDPKIIAQFNREGKVGLTLKHPNIVEVLHISQDEASQQYYIIMEFVEGGNLREILAIRHKYSVAEALRIIEGAASGLAGAYAKGLTHRDIKLTNILISSTGEAKLVDFGLAQLFTAGKEKMDRTVDYAGLERATNVKQGDVRSDIYFLGCVLYECVTGRSPLEMTRDRYARMRKERFEKVPPIRPEELDGPPSVIGLIETMMSLLPTRRYQTPSQLVDAIRVLRREVEGKGPARSEGGTGSRSVFVAEKNERLQETLREAFRKVGYRVFIAADPARALDRFIQQPYDALVVDVGTTGKEGLQVFKDVRAEAARKRVPVAAVVILAEDQKDWVSLVGEAPGSAVLVQPVKFKQLHHTLRDLMNGTAPGG
jgi:CheY-like chemotaxis protein/tRNA A-37 threonylcarbamoyl transferase component Bud32